MSRPRRVLFLIDTLEVGGAEKSLLALLPKLRSVQPVLCHLYPGAALREQFEVAGLRVLSLALPGSFSFRRAVAAFGAVVREERADIVHSTLFRSGVVARAVGRRLGVPVIDSFVSDAYGRERRAAFSPARRLKLSAIQVLDRLTAPWVDHFVAISATVMRSNCRALGVSERRCTVIPRGREFARFASVAPAETEQVRAALGLRENDRVLLCVARLLEGKGQETLLKALPAILARHPGAKLLLAGDGPARPALVSLANALGVGQRVLFLGTRTDIPGLLHLADVFAFPSLHEGLGGALIEAMMAARPVVAADTPVHRESIASGVTGLLVPPGDPGALAGAAIALLEDRQLAAGCGARAREAARERYDISRVAARHEELYACEVFRRR